MIVYNGSVWHGHTANRSDTPRRSIRGAYIRREARSGTDLPARMRPETISRLGAIEMYSVLTHPRCVNCHTATNYPGQGDDRHPHLFNVARGQRGHGVPALTCATCHQRANADSTGVPGAPGWQLAPLSMKWQDLNDHILASSAVCRTVTDRSKNHNLDGAGLLKHHLEEPLVLWAFQPGRSAEGSATLHSALDARRVRRRHARMG
jgi:hypothetical protein